MIVTVRQRFFYIKKEQEKVLFQKRKKTHRTATVR